MLTSSFKAITTHSIWAIYWVLTKCTCKLLSVLFYTLNPFVHIKLKDIFWETVKICQLEKQNKAKKKKKKT